jgi:hypothetical protein
VPFLAGQIVKAGMLNRLQPKKYSAIGTGTLTGPLTNVDVPNATVTMTTETAATYVAWCVWDDNTTSPSSGTQLGRLAIDGLNQSPLSVAADPAGNARGTVAQNYHGVLTAAGTHTFKLVASPLTGQQVQGVNCSIIVEITEVI